MKDINWKEGYVEIPKPKNPKKITGTRFAALLGYNKWNTPFKTWCEITRTYEEPFEDTKYTIAGKVIEPLQHKYMQTGYFMKNLVTPTAMYGDDYFEKTHGDFFPNNKVFGGMWDALLVDENGKPTTVIEFKTTSRVEDWTADLPDYYGLQASLYAYLLGIEDVIMVCSFLTESDYEHPEQYHPDIENTIVKQFKVHERYKHFDEYIDKAKAMYDYLEVSPYYDEEKDAEIIKALQTISITGDETADELLNEMAELKDKLDAYDKEIKPLEKAYKGLQDKIKALALKQFNQDVKSVVLANTRLTVSLDKSVRADVDKKALETDGLLEKYTVSKEIYTLRVKEGK